MEGKPDRIRISIGRTLSLGNYESERYDIAVSSDVENEETLEDARARITAEVIETLNEVIEIAREEVKT